MPAQDASETAQSDADATDGSDKPPQRPPMNGSHNPNGMHHSSGGVPLPPKESGAFPKETGHTAADLAKLVRSEKAAVHSDDASAPASPVLSVSPTATESETWSLPPSRPPSAPGSRAPSFSSGVSGNKLAPASTPAKTHKKKDDAHEKKGKGGPPSVHSDKGEGQKFTLKDLLANGPKLARRTSQKSAGSSRRSDSDSKSQAGDSAVSLQKKYGVCAKVAIGKGATSVVRLAHKWDRTEEKLYAVKEFRKRRKNESEKEYVKKLTAEFCISSTLHHVNIVETVDLVQDEAQHWCEVMEFCPGGDLYAAIKKGGMSPSEVECCFKQILSGVAYLHSQGVAHRDIKPENLFFDTKGHLKIGDYGASTVYRLPWEATIHMSTGLCGSEPYIAPEQFLGKPYDARLVDIWACGIVYYCLHFQELPWRVAQKSDPLYEAYAQACAAAPCPPLSADKDGNAHDKPEKKDGAGHTHSHGHGHGHDKKDGSSHGAFPPTINNLSPRACRPVIRRMLDPDPKLRTPIEDVMRQPWLEAIEVCYAAPKPSHVHVHARALAKAQVQMLE